MTSKSNEWTWPSVLVALAIGWLLVFMAAARKIHEFIDEDPKLDS